MQCKHPYAFKINAVNEAIKASTMP